MDTKIAFGNNSAETFDNLGFRYISSDNRYGADTRGFEKIAYAEIDGEGVYPKTTLKPFDYKIVLAIEAGKGKYINKIVSDFNKKMLKQNTTNEYMECSFYHKEKRLIIKGIPQPLSVASKMALNVGGYDVAVFTLTINVNNPNSCNFNWGGVVG